MSDPFDKRHWAGPEKEQPPDFGGPVGIPFEPFPDAWIERPIAAQVELAATHYGEKLAVEDDALSLTYAELWRSVSDLTRRIESLVPVGRPIGVLLPHGALFPVAALACLASGRPFVPIDLNYPAAHGQRIIDEAGLAAVIIDGRSRPSLTIAPAMPCLDVAESLAASVAAQTTIAPSHGPAIILYTSGSTGRPKGICNDQRAILQRVGQAINAYHLSSLDRSILLSSPCTIAGVREMFAPLLCGATLYLADPLRLGIGGVLQMVKAKRVSLCYGVPALLRALLAAPMAKQAFADLRLIRTGGDNPLDSDLALYREALPPSCHILISFSSTEVPIAFQWFVPSDWRADKPRLPVGYARPGIEFMLLGKDGGPVAQGEAGELVVRSRYLALGLWQDGYLQPGPFVTDHADPETRIFHTGDLVRLRADGLAEMIGRTDREIKIRGWRVDPGPAEAMLRGCRGVTDVAVVARRSGEEVTALIAYVESHAAVSASLADELKNALASSLPQAMRPTEIHILDALPRLPSFKLDIKTLERLDREYVAGLVASQREPGFAPMRLMASTTPGDIRAIVEQAWAGKLSRQSFDANLAWDAAGGDSLKALEFWLDVERAIGRRLPLDILPSNITPSELILALAAALHTERDGEAERARSNRPTIFLMPGIAGDEPLLADFRAQFGGGVRFEVIDYPDWRAMIDGGVRLEPIIDAAVAQIGAKLLDGTCFLAGYSYGGLIAYEAARRLVAAGRRVGLLALLDSRPTVGLSLRQSIENLLRNPRAMLLPTLEQGFIALCLHWRWFGLLSALSARALSWRSSFAFWYQKQLIRSLRLAAMQDWHPTPLRVPTMLLSSAEGLPGLAPDLGWGDLCQPLQVIPIGGTHRSILTQPLLAVLCGSIAQAIGDQITQIM